MPQIEHPVALCTATFYAYRNSCLQDLEAPKKPIMQYVIFNHFCNWFWSNMVFHFSFLIIFTIDIFSYSFVYDFLYVLPNIRFSNISTFATKIQIFCQQSFFKLNDTPYFGIWCWKLIFVKDFRLRFHTSRDSNSQWMVHFVKPLANFWCPYVVTN